MIVRMKPTNLCNATLHLYRVKLSFEYLLVYYIILYYIILYYILYL